MTYEEKLKNLRTARKTLHILEHRGILENNLSTEHITAIRIAEFALDELCKSKDVQPVVRCKDCKHRKERHYEESGEKPYIKYECKFTKYSMSDDGFCSFGARMDGEQDD